MTDKFIHILLLWPGSPINSTPDGIGMVTTETTD